MDQGYKPFFLSFMFQPVSFSPKENFIPLAQGDIRRFYSRIVTRFAHRPNDIRERNKLPIMLAAPDLPVPKTEKSSIQDVSINDGLHFHAMFLQPPVSRFKRKFHLWAKANHDQLIDETHIARLWVGRVVHTPDYMTEYAFKTVGNKLSMDTILVLPEERKTTVNPTDKGYDEACRRLPRRSKKRIGA
ncbi:hypothetical protein [Aquabacter cavernae]|uniref:hypothetical protein n=1 Tax=Aquabacter cavernae TaxID=2496029 RepID=UPI000F8D888F|nr:hypothetical protein [Aquabacter cavernae]